MKKAPIQMQCNIILETNKQFEDKNVHSTRNCAWMINSIEYIDVDKTAK